MRNLRIKSKLRPETLLTIQRQPVRFLKTSQVFGKAGKLEASLFKTCEVFRDLTG